MVERAGFRVGISLSSQSSSVKNIIFKLVLLGGMENEYGLAQSKEPERVSLQSRVWWGFEQTNVSKNTEQASNLRAWSHGEDIQMPGIIAFRWYGLSREPGNRIKYRAQYGEVEPNICTGNKN